MAPCGRTIDVFAEGANDCRQVAPQTGTGKLYAIHEARGQIREEHLNGVRIALSERCAGISFESASVSAHVQISPATRSSAIFSVTCFACNSRRPVLVYLNTFAIQVGKIRCGPQKHTEGSEQFGRKPFTVISRDVVNGRLKTVFVVPMTTHQGQTDDAPFLASQPPWRNVVHVSEIIKDPNCNTILSGRSVVKTDQARVIDKNRLQQKIGRLSQTAVISVGIGLAYVFDIR